MKRFCFWPGVLLIYWGVAVAALKAQSHDGRQIEVRFCAYNLKNYLKMPRFVHGERADGIGKPEGEIKAVVKFLTAINADVLGLTEIGTLDDLKDLQQRLKTQGLDYPFSEHTHGGDPARCQALLSRLPVVASDSQTRLTYPIGDQVFPMQRGIMDVILQAAPAHTIRCLGVHLKSKREVAEGDQSLMRRNEAWLLRQHVDEILRQNPQTLLLVHGDFNEHSHEVPLMELRGPAGGAMALVDLKLVDGRGQTWTHYWAEADTYSRFDYFFMNRALMRRVDREQSYVYDVADFATGSDHRPVVVTFRFAGRNKG